MKPETAKYIRNAADLSSERQRIDDDLDYLCENRGTDPETAKARRTMSANILSLRARAVSLRLSSLAIGACLLLALSAPSWAQTDNDLMQLERIRRVKPEVSITVKVYPGRGQKVRVTPAGCVAWVPTVESMDAGWGACKVALREKK